MSLSILQLLSQSPSLDQFRSVAYKQYGIKCNTHGNLILLSTVHNSRKTLNSSYAQECNGLIIERETNRVVCYPPRCLKSNHVSSRVGQYLKDGLYKVYAAEFGTVVSLYYYGDEWHVSTSNATSARQMRWTPEGKTYGTMIDECLAQYGLTLDTFIAVLDPTMCYSIGFKHPDMHKFRPDELRAWFVQRVCLNPQAPQYLFANDESPTPALAGQRCVEYPITVRDLYAAAKNALPEYLAKKDAPLYGYILRGSPTTCTDHSDLYVESSLSASIRKIWQDNHVVRQMRRATIPYDAFVCVQQFLAANQQFLELFPQYRDKFNEMGDKLSALAILLAEDRAITTVSLQSIALARCKTAVEKSDPRPTTAQDFHEYLHNIVFLDDLADYLWSYTASE